MNEEYILDVESGMFTLQVEKPSGWVCVLLGKNNPMRVEYHPSKGQVPNWFHRKMQELCFGVKWIKNP